MREHCVEGLSVYILDRGRAALRHTYNSLGDYEKAEDYLRQALKFIEQEAGMNKGNRGGACGSKSLAWRVLASGSPRLRHCEGRLQDGKLVGMCQDRLGKHKEALPDRHSVAPWTASRWAPKVCIKAYEFYKDYSVSVCSSVFLRNGRTVPPHLCRLRSWTFGRVLRFSLGWHLVCQDLCQAG